MSSIENTEAKFAIFRAGFSGYQSIGPTAQRLTIEQARDDIAILKRRYPNQEFVILGEVGTATKSERVTVKIAAPELGTGKVVQLKCVKENAR